MAGSGGFLPLRFWAGNARKRTSPSYGLATAMDARMDQAGAISLPTARTSSASTNGFSSRGRSS
jgi:hypothetical protein